MNDRQCFVKQVQAQLPPALESESTNVPDLVDMLAGAGLINYDHPQQDVKKVIQFLPRWAVHRKKQATDDTIEGEISAHALLATDSLVELLEPEIRAIRETYFGSEAPPFDGFKQAEQWLAPISGELLNRAGLVAVYGYREDELEFSSQEAEKWDLILKRLCALSEKTGISPTSLEYYVLADIKPLSSPYEIVTVGKEYCKGRRKCYYVNIKVNTELGFSDLRRIYGTVKEALGVKKGKRMNERHLELHSMVQERGGVPKGKGIVRFWQSLLEEWNGTHKGEYREWRCIKRAYDRLCKKLNAQYSAEEAKEDEAD